MKPLKIHNESWIPFFLNLIKYNLTKKFLIFWFIQITPFGAGTTAFQILDIPEDWR